MILIVRGLDQRLSEDRNKGEIIKVVTLFSFEGTTSKFGGDSKEVPPVPIPNTEVKLFHVDNTWWATAREDR